MYNVRPFFGPNLQTSVGEIDNFCWLVVSIEHANIILFQAIYLELVTLLLLSPLNYCPLETMDIKCSFFTSGMNNKKWASTFNTMCLC